MTLKVEVEFDDRQLKRWRERLSLPMYHDALDAAETDLQLIGQTAAMGATPAPNVHEVPRDWDRTGHARRSTVTDVRGAEKRIIARYPYFRWLNEGKDSRGRVMKVRRGGYRIRKATLETMREQAPRVLHRAGREMQEKWAQ